MIVKCHKGKDSFYKIHNVKEAVREREREERKKGRNEKCTSAFRELLLLCTVCECEYSYVNEKLTYILCETDLQPLDSSFFIFHSSFLFFFHGYYYDYNYHSVHIWVHCTRFIICHSRCQKLSALIIYLDIGQYILYVPNCSRLKICWLKSVHCDLPLIDALWVIQFQSCLIFCRCCCCTFSSTIVHHTFFSWKKWREKRWNMK